MRSQNVKKIKDREPRDTLAEEKGLWTDLCEFEGRTDGREGLRTMD